MSTYQNDNQYGGGYINDGGSSPSNTDSPSKGKGPRSTGNYSITPVTVKQLGQAMQVGDAFKVDNFELHMITIVGVIVRENKVATNWTFDIDDGTGEVQARIWIESDDATSNHISEQLRNVGVNKYVRVVGHLRTFNGERSLIAYRIIPIEDFNEITFHHLDTINVHVSRVRGHLGDTSNFNSNYSNNSNGNNKSYVNNIPASGSGSGFSDVQRGILSILRENVNTQEGVAVFLENAYTRTDIVNALDFLMNEGHIYTGIDDNHIKASEAE